MRNELFAAQIQEAFREFVLRSDFPCLGAKAAFNANAQTLRVLDELGSLKSTVELAAALSEFTASLGRTDSRPSDYASFIAIFVLPRQMTELEFEQRLWRQLRLLHERDSARFEWARRVASDPDDPHFAFSFAGQAFYVIGMHGNSSRAARRFPWPVMIFNPHEQFERLRSDGKWKHMQETIRQRDFDFQGSVNPMLSDFGEQTEARQYSGRAVEEEWRAPFRAANPGKCPFHH